MTHYDDLNAADRAVVDAQVSKMLADPTRIPSELRQRYAGDTSGLTRALREGYADPVKIDLLRQQQRAESLGATR